MKNKTKNSDSPLQVKHFRGQVGLEDVQSKVQLDSSGLKKLFSYAIRRFCDRNGNLQSREAQIW